MTTKLNWRDERGDTLVLITVFIVALLAFAALSIDVGHVFQKQRAAHVGTDAAALAGATVLTNRPQVKAAVIEEAETIAVANGVTLTEIGSTPAGQVEVGLWQAGVFTADATSNGFYNAVRVPAQRTVELAFGRVVGQTEMKPGVHSVAILDRASSAYGIPFAIGTNVYAAATNGVISTGGFQGPGNWGIIDLCGRLNGSREVIRAITNANCVLEQYTDFETSPNPGVDGLRQGFNARWQNQRDETFVLPVVNRLPNGRSETVRILSFVCVRMEAAPRGGGNNLELRFRIVPNCLLGLDPGGTGTDVFTRVLVE